MDTLNYDISNLIFNQLPVVDQLKLHRLFHEQKPTQFRVSSELLASKPLKGPKGLFKRALTTGEYEPCVLTMVSIMKSSIPEHIELYEADVRAAFHSYDEWQRVSRIIMQISRLPLSA